MSKEKEDEYHEYHIERVELGPWRNMERPYDAAELLQLAAEWIEQHTATRPDGKWTFLVRSVDVSLYNGTITLYLSDNGLHSGD